MPNHANEVRDTRGLTLSAVILCVAASAAWFFGWDDASAPGRAVLGGYLEGRFLFAFALSWFAVGILLVRIFRPGSDPDGATPAAGGLAALGLARIASIGEREDFERAARSIVARDGPIADRQPTAFPTLVRAAAFLDAGGGLGLVLGDADDPGARALAARARRLLGPDDAIVITHPDTPCPHLGRGWLEGRGLDAGLPTAYLCRGRACSLPATTPEALRLP